MIENSWLGGGDWLGNTGDFLRAEIIHHDDIARSENCLT
jgi:hypothetical protein